MQRKPLLLVISLIVALVAVVGSVYYWYPGRLPGDTQFFTPDLQDGSQTEAPETPTLVPSSNSSYTGILPCSDCEGIQTTLTLDPVPEGQLGAAYTLSEIYLGKSTTPVETTGYWILRNSSIFPNARYSEPQTFVVLDLGMENQRLFLLSNNGTTLTVLDAEGNPLTTSQNTTLTQQDAVPVTTQTLPLGGEVATEAGNIGRASPPPPEVLNAQ